MCVIHILHGLRGEKKQRNGGQGSYQGWRRGDPRTELSLKEAWLPPRLEGKEAGSQAPRVESREGGDGEDCPRPVPPVCSEFMGLRKDMETESQ